MEKHFRQVHSDLETWPYIIYIYITTVFTNIYIYDIHIFFTIC